MTHYRSSCNYVTDTWTTTEHLAGCNEGTCPGCRPCEHDHCAMRERCANHVDWKAGIITCPSCIGRTRKDLKTIVRLSLFDIPVEVLDAGTNSEAMNIAGVATIMLPIDSRRGWCDFPPKEHHPFTVLAGWELALREDYGPVTELRLTTPRAADYLDMMLNGPFPHERRFEEFAREIRQCRAHLESVVHDSNAPETGAPCPECEGKAPKLVKRYGPTTKDDAWHCPTNPAQHSWTDVEYQLRVAEVYVEHADWLPVNDAAKRLGIKVGAVKMRAKRREELREDDKTIPSGKKRHDGQTLYSVRLLA